MKILSSPAGFGPDERLRVLQMPLLLCAEFFPMSSAGPSKHVTPELLRSSPSGLPSQRPSRPASASDVARVLDGLAREIETDACRDPCGYLQRTNTYQHGE